MDYFIIFMVVFSYLLIGIIGLIEFEVIEVYGESEVKVYIFSFVLMYIVVICYC